MATNPSLKFFRAATTPASAAIGAIWFDTKNRTIQLKTGDSTWEPYAGKLQDASWDYEHQKLTIRKYDDSSIELDFSQVATLANVSAAISAAVTPVANRVTTAEGKIADLETKVGTPKVEGESPADATGLFKAIEDEKKARETADTALDGKVKKVSDDLAAETSARTQADAEHDRRLTEVEGKVGALSTATHFVGKYDTIQDALTHITAKGDIVIVGNKEYIYNAAVSAESPVAEGNLVELGDTTDEVARITTLEGKMQTAEGEIDALQSGLSDEIARAKAAEEANAAAIAAEKTRAEGKEGELAAAITKETNDRISAIDTAIKDLDATVRGNLTDQDAIASGKHVGVKVVEVDGKLNSVTVVEDDIASATALETLSGKVTTMDGSLGTAKSEIAALQGLHADKEGGKKSVNEEITEAVANIKKDSTEAASASGKVKVTYSQTNGVVSMQVAEDDIASASELATAKSDISDLKTKMSTAEGNITQLRTDLTAEATTARAAEKANADAIKAEKERAIARENELDAKITSSIAGAMVWESFE